MPFMFENLKVYQKAVAFADEISSLTEGFSKGNYYLTDQLNRAALSIAANIAEGNGRYGKADRKNFLGFREDLLLSVSRYLSCVSERN